MARTLSSTARAAMYARETDAILCVLLEIAHDDLAAPLLLCNNTEDLTYGGDTYLTMPFEVALPNAGDAPPRAQLRICAVDRTVIAAIRSIETAPTVKLSVALVNAVDDVAVEIGPIEMILTNVSYDAYIVTGELSFTRLLDEGFPAHAFTPLGFPGIWESRPDLTAWPVTTKTTTVEPAKPRGWPRYRPQTPRRGQEP